MKRRYQTAVAVSTSACLIGCTTLRTVGAEGSAAGLGNGDHGGITAGDTVVIDTRDGKSMTLDVTSLDATGLSGKDDATHQPSRVSWSDVEKLQRQEIDAGRTIGLVALVAVVLVGWGAIALNHMFAH